MQNLNPRKYNAPKSYNANCYADRMGFAMRDELTTKSTSVAGVVNPLGASIARAVESYQSGDTSSYYAYNSGTTPIRIPGIMTFDFEPVFAPQSGERKQIVEDIFNNWWSVYRLYYNGADTIQPADIAIRCMGQMLVDMYVQYIRRAFDVMKTSYSANNTYVRNTVLLNAMGLQKPANVSNWDFYIRTNFTDWVSYFNDSILGSLNACKWIGGIFPGEHRWSSLVTEIYKDESIDSDYVQLYLFKPRSFYMLQTNEVEPGIYAWELVRSDFPTDFETLLQRVHDFIRALYYDSSALSIQAMLQTISVRGKTNETMIYDLAYDQYELTGGQLKFTFDWQMLLAIHNATIMYGLRAFDVTQDPSTGRVTQEFAFDQTSYSWPWFATPKIINLPNFAASQEEIINAAQWQITGTDTDIITGRQIDPGTLGTDVIVDSRIVRYNQDSDTVTLTPTYQFFRSTYVPGATEATTYQGFLVSEVESIFLLTQFNMHPIGYYATAENDTRGPVTGYIGQLDVVYRISPTELRDLKKAFVNNFWGYPIRLRSTGSFALPNRVVETDAGVGAGSGKQETSAT